MAVFQIADLRPPVLEDLNLTRLFPSETNIIPEMVRIQESHGLQLIFFKDYERVLESGGIVFAQMINRNGLDIDRIGLVLEEIDVINNPHTLNDAKHYVNPKRVYIRPMNTKKGRKMLEDALEQFEKFGDETLFENFVNLPLNENSIRDVAAGFGVGMAQGVKNGVKDNVKQVKQDVKSGIKKAGLVAGGMLAANAIASHYANKYADEDARKHPDDRSDLIKKLRILRGKLPEYESKYQRAEREKWENRGIIGKIIYKIKTAIANILHKLKRATIG